MKTFAPFQLTIEPIDLDKAIAETKRVNNNYVSVCATCLLAQALKRQTNGIVKEINFGFDHGDSHYYTEIGSKARQLMEAFDEGKYTTVRKQLPITVEIPQVKLKYESSLSPLSLPPPFSADH